MQCQVPSSSSWFERQRRHDGIASARGSTQIVVWGSDHEQARSYRREKRTRQPPLIVDKSPVAVCLVFRCLFRASRASFSSRCHHDACRADRAEADLPAPSVPSSSTTVRGSLIPPFAHANSNVIVGTLEDPVSIHVISGYLFYYLDFSLHYIYIYI